MSEKYYNEIDYFPLMNWIEANKGRLEFTRIEKKNGSEKEDLKAFEEIFNDFIKKVGFSEDYEKLTDLKKKLLIIGTKYLETRERILLNDINVLNVQINDLKTSLVSSKNEYQIGLNYLSKKQGYTINSKDITTLEYFVMLKEK